MSSNIALIRICNHCRKEFTAKTTVTKFCSHKCNSKAYKLKLTTEKIQKSNHETKQIQYTTIESIKLKEYLTVKDAATILNSSIRTIYNLINSKTLIATNISKRKTLIKRMEIEKLFEINMCSKSNIIKEDVNLFFKIEYYRLSEIQEKYKISESGINGLIRKYNLPRAKEGLFTLLEKDKIDKLLGNHDNS